ncbi:DUF4830 domain-containing protein [Anaerotruncus colihominis]|uniref:DUF4830 domain-containing protein n=1 Tax=Anaerotruncus colihominis TaxID=169435 RepID=UPI001FACFDCD|nr:DUF4830 domain-containing protein [Anaerotruncus colihominis]MCR2025614.1 DUF4830 domain-containing protein [Anaerotruncus colihominis]
MFTISFRVTKRQVAAAAAVFVLSLVGGVWGRAAISELRGSPVRADSEVKVAKVAAKTEEQRVDFLESFGWQVEPEADEVVEVQIPKEFDDVFTNYNTIQKTQGCNLEKYAGKRCKRYTYIVTNYPGQTDNVRANILVYKDKVIGGDVCSLELGGFMHGFVVSQQNVATTTPQNGTGMQSAVTQQNAA